MKESDKLRTIHKDRVLYFRGESRTKSGNRTRKLEPSIMRDPVLHSNERNMLLDLMSRRPENFEGVTSALSQWVLAQHHGLKTRLLDTTRNPLVALFNVVKNNHVDGRIHVFSVPRSIVKPFSSDTVRIITNFAKLSRVEQNQLLGFRDQKKGYHLSITRDHDGISTYSNTMNRLYDLIWQEKPGFAKKIDPKDFFGVYIVEPQQSFPRIRAQSGAFLISAFHQRFERDKVESLNPSTPMYEHSVFKVPADRKQQIADQLQLLGIDREALFPGLDEAANSVMKYVIDLAKSPHKEKKGQNTFSYSEAMSIRAVIKTLEEIRPSNPTEAKRLRNNLRDKFNFYISDFHQSGFGVTTDDFDELVLSGAIVIQF